MKSAITAAVLILACLPSRGLAQAPSKAGPASLRPLEEIHLGGGRKLIGEVVKSNETFLFVDLGFDILKVPKAAVLRREKIGVNRATKAKVVDEEVFFRAERAEKTISEGAAEVGEAVVKIVTSNGQGSGFITSADGYIVTNFHVVAKEIEASVTIYMKSRNGFDLKTIRKVKVIATNPHVDLALLKMEPPKGVTLKYVFLGDSTKVKVGQKVFAIGTPIGLERTVSEGMISVTNRTWSGFTHFQMTTPINPGNSGGPLFNLRGEVVGVNSSGYRGAQGLNFAIPSKYVIDFLRNRDAFALDITRSENGVHYMPGPRKPKKPKKPKPKPKKKPSKPATRKTATTGKSGGK